MAFTGSTISNLSSIFPLRNLPFSLHHRLSLSVSFPKSAPTAGLTLCRAAKPQTGPTSRRSSPPNNKKSKNTGGGGGRGADKFESKSKSKASTLRRGGEADYRVDEPSEFNKGGSGHQPTTLLNPPAGFEVDAEGRVHMTSSERIVTLVDPDSKKPLECVIRRAFRSSQGDECILACPADMPISILKSSNFEGWSVISDEEVEAVRPDAAYALAKIHVHFVNSGFCYTSRGGFCYCEDDIFNIDSDDGEDAKGIEVTTFHVDGSSYMIYTPEDPLLFIAVKGSNGIYQLADDELLEDPDITSAINEETEFNAFAQEEEAALLEAMAGRDD